MSAQIRIDADRRLIEEHDARLVHDGSPEVQPPLHAAGIRASAIVREIAQADRGQHGIDTVGQAGSAHAVKLAEKREVLAGREFGVQRPCSCRAMPIASRLSPSTPPSSRTAPEVGVARPDMMAISVDLPAPLGPSKPKSSPASIANETPASTRESHNVC